MLINYIWVAKVSNNFLGWKRSSLIQELITNRVTKHWTLMLWHLCYAQLKPLYWNWFIMPHKTFVLLLQNDWLHLIELINFWSITNIMILKCKYECCSPSFIFREHSNWHMEDESTRLLVFHCMLHIFTQLLIITGFNGVSKKMRHSPATVQISFDTLFPANHLNREEGQRLAERKCYRPCFIVQKPWCEPINSCRVNC